ncbi:putative LPS assembly protein LptD [Duncaniella muricolitica]|uniref:putative LPS assembly protein LptD n=1 Tax=Duncaniella muricolitica TaxID=2880704 RepID=UPI00244D9D89|nr:putative LPS assembly protein LptD [Duncaniella muricolitica]
MRKTQLYIIAIVLLCALSVGAISRPVNSDAGLPHAAHADSTAIDSDTTTRTDSPSDSVSAGARRIIDLIGDTSEPEAADTVVSVETHDTATATGPVLTAPRLPVDSAGLMPDTIAMPDSLMTDSLAEAPRSVLQRHEMSTDSTRRPRLSRRRISAGDNGTRSKIVRTKVDLDNAVDFSAKDSMVMTGQNRAYMYGDGKVTYGSIKLDANEIEMNLDSTTVYAVGTVDSVGDLKGSPVFDDNGTTYEAKTMRYNFKTEKGFITDVITQQGEGYLTGGQSKKIDENTIYIENARYTTCDDHEHPHFWMQLTKGKVRPGKDAVTGPAYMVLAGLPLPLAVPFGYFPFSEKYSSGIIFPTFGDDYNRGYYLSNGGYYFAISQNMDLALTGEIYTLGSWGLRAQSAYLKRYKYSGNFNISYLKTITGDKGMPDYAKSTNFQILWSHSQDSKANPNMSFSASVNFTTSGYTRNDLNSYYSSAFTENTKSSTINMTYRFPNSKWSLSTTANVSQRTQDSTLAVSFPNFTLTMSQVYPFKRKKAVGAEKWYEKIKLSYSGQFNNSLTAKQDVFFQKSLIKDWRNGMKHSVPISATFNVFKYFNITPSVSLTDRMYTTKVRRQWDPNASAEVLDTTYSFYNVWDFSGSVSLDTKIYGFFQPLPFLGKKVKMIRHVMTPTISFSGSPDFASPFFGYYGSYEYTDAQGRLQKKQYSMFPNSLFGVPGSGRNGSVSFSLANNLEMKVRDDNDSIGEKKVSLIENFTLSQSYNFAADSMNWSNLNTSIMLRLTKSFNLNLSATWDVYMYGLNANGNPVRINKLRLTHGKGWGKLSSTGTSFSYTFNNDTFKKWFGGGDDKDKNKDKDNKNTPDRTPMDDPARPTNANDTKKNKNGIQIGDNGYMAWNVPWNLSFNYSVNYGYGEFDYNKLEYKGKITQNLSLSGNIRPTTNWNIGFSASYNFDTHKIAYMNCNISRDMHCFTMRASFVPVGPYKSYNFHISVKSSLLSDLKYDKRSSSSNGVRW